MPTDQNQTVNKLPKRNILYTAGGHGNFIRFIFDCYDQHKILPMPFNTNGNSHRQEYAQTRVTNRRELCEFPDADHWHDINDRDDTYAVVWQGLEQFYYMMQCYVDRGAGLLDNGIDTLENDIGTYEKTYGYPVTISSDLKNFFNFDVHKHGQPSRALLRNYFLLSFYNFFDNIIWRKNKILIEQCEKVNYEKIYLADIWDYNVLKNKMDILTDSKLVFKDVHDRFLARNIPYKQLQKVKKILDCVQRQDDATIDGLNVISEAYLVFSVECEHFDVPFNLGISFFRTAREINDYVNFFPDYMKRPNNLFEKNYKFYRRGKDVEI